MKHFNETITAVQAVTGLGFGKGLLAISEWQKGREIQEKRTVRRPTCLIHLWRIGTETAVIEEDRDNRVVVRQGKFISGKPAWRLINIEPTQDLDTLVTNLYAHRGSA